MERKEILRMSGRKGWAEKENAAGKKKGNRKITDHREAKESMPQPNSRRGGKGRRGRGKESLIPNVLVKKTEGKSSLIVEIA